MNRSPALFCYSRHRALAAQFAIAPPLGAIAPLGGGLINDTFSLEAGGQRYVLQRINGTVFPDPAQIMANLRMLAAHLVELAARGESVPRLPALIATRDGADTVRDGDGSVWRLLEFIPDAVTLPRLATLTQARAVGALLGRFHRAVASLPIARLGDSLPGFHATPAYLARLETVVTHADCRTPAIRAALAFVRARQTLAEVLDRAWRSGRIVRRITHGDPKLDNILFTRDGRQALALIDLDTVQPGLIQHDLGDCLRSCCQRSAPDGTGARFARSLCAGILTGYAGEMRALLTVADIALFYDAIRLLPFELGIRFLADHLEGDRYFRVAAQGENLRRAEAQFALVADIERQESALRALIARCFPSADLTSSPA